MAFRTEDDSMGEIEVPEEAYYGAFTVRARSNFQLTDETVHPELIHALAAIKKAAARANSELDLLDNDRADAIIDAAEEVRNGRFDESFVLDTIQAGAGTATHMNANEVIANRATELLGGTKGEYTVHPNDHVNMGQSSNNVVPTAVRLASMQLLDRADHELAELQDALRDKADRFSDVVKVGRTHLQDAVPVRIGQEFDAYATSVKKARQRLAEAHDELREVGLGGNAVGTGINTPESFREAVVAELADVTGRDLEPTEDTLQMTQSMTPLQRLADAVTQYASDGIKMSDDLMLLASGPVAGLGELKLPEVEPGSSIMPGKVNPSIVEAYKMSLIQVKADADAVSRAAEHGDLEMNVMAPVIARNLFDALELVIRATKMMRVKCIEGIEADQERIQELFSGSTATATALSPYIGYNRTAEVVHAAVQEDRSVREVVLERELMTADELDRVLDPERMTAPHGVDSDLQETVQERIGDTDGR